ncbi:MAG TPA: RDD family protein [Candidatus Dormibacteraeota bacterium]|nr:RDD family protein [Candidatus Dormibacteraeota bacterium]
MDRAVHRRPGRPDRPGRRADRTAGRALTLVIAAWNLWYTQGRTGQSLGKLVVGTRLVSEGTGQPVGVLTAFLRSVAHLVDALPCFVGYLWPIWHARRQTFADELAGTVVVKA